MLLSCSQPSWFHLHTTYSEGLLKVEEYFKLARSYGIQSLVFLEQITKNPSYSVDKYIGEVRKYAKQYGIQALAGFEARILPDGELDISDRALEKCDILGIAEHGFPANMTLFRTAFREAIKTASEIAESKDVVWVHPGLFFKKNRLMTTHGEEYEQLLSHAVESGIQLELNLRYNLIDREHACRFPCILGIDAYSEADLVKFEEMHVSSLATTA